MHTDILFYQPKELLHKPWDGDSIRTGGVGVSGSHQTSVLAAEYIARTCPGTKVYFYGDCKDSLCRGVHYISNLQSARSATLLIAPSWDENYEYVRMLPRLSHIVIWFHCNLLGPSLAFALNSIPNSLSFTFVHLSEWSKGNILKMMVPEVEKRVRSHYVMPNALMDDILPQYNSQMRPNDSAFIASYERGGEIASRVWDRLKAKSASHWGNMITKGYRSADNQIDKQAVYRLYSNVRYFIYPSVLPPPTYSVHRDTFGCCVAEAIACGVEVLSYPIGALPEHFKDMINWIPFPLGITSEAINNCIYDPRIPELWGNMQVDVIVNMIEELDRTWEARSDKRRSNAERIKKLYSPNTTFSVWLDIVKNS